jgi:hypothetical protein
LPTRHHSPSLCVLDLSLQIKELPKLKRRELSSAT